MKDDSQKSLSQKSKKTSCNKPHKKFVSLLVAQLRTTMEEQRANCKTNVMGIKDSMSILSGKWKLHILGTLLLHDKLRFMELQRALGDISAKVLSKELRDLELNQLIYRTEIDGAVVAVEYEISPFGITLTPVIQSLANWGNTYRQEIIQQMEKNKGLKTK
ncbi:helix-turn-helix transcriptional regulator [Myroides odoratus]|nr:helix-turn-helix transcriptional regulator [Myroides odoratus]